MSRHRTGRTSRSGLLAPELLARICTLDVAARRIVEGTMVGLHSSLSHGVGSEFAQYRPYMPGDDLRDLDWKVLGRTDRYYVRQYTAETNLHAWVVVDATASMQFASAGVTKFDVVRMLAAAIAYLLIGQGDRVGTLPIAGRGAVDPLPPRGGERHLHTLLHGLERIEPEGEASVVAALDGGLERFARRGPIFVLSDLYEDADAIGNATARLTRAGFDVSLFHVLDPLERTLEIDRETEFVGLEEEGRVAADPRRLRRAYLERLAEHTAALRRRAAASGVAFVDVDTSVPLDRPLAECLRARRSRGGRA